MEDRIDQWRQMQRSDYAVARDKASGWIEEHAAQQCDSIATWLGFGRAIAGMGAGDEVAGKRRGRIMQEVDTGRSVARAVESLVILGERWGGRFVFSRRAESERGEIGCERDGERHDADRERATAAAAAPSTARLTRGGEPVWA